MHALFEDMIRFVVAGNILYHDSVNCSTGSSNTEIKLLQGFEMDSDGNKHPTLESDGHIGQAYTWNMVQKPPNHTAWTICKQP